MTEAKHGPVLEITNQRIIFIDGEPVSMKPEVLETLITMAEDPKGEFTRQDLWQVAYPDGRPFDRDRCRALLNGLRNLRASETPVVASLRLSGIQTVYYLDEDLTVIRHPEELTEEETIEEDPADTARRELVRRKIQLFRKLDLLNGEVTLKRLLRDIGIKAVHFERTIGKDWRHQARYDIVTSIWLACIKTLDLKISLKDSERLKEIIAEELGFV